jgi:predicted ATPase
MSGETTDCPALLEIETRLVEIKAALQGVEQGLGLVIQSIPSLEPEQLLHVLHDRLRLELGHLDEQTQAVHRLCIEHIKAVAS